MKNTFYFLFISILFVTCQKDEEDQFIGDSGAFTDTRDNQTYLWVRIGDQIWMAENLAYLPKVSPPSGISNTEPYYYVYGYNGTDVAAAKATDNYATYGVLYNWPAAKSACPPGWHLPTDDEWTALTTFLGGESVAGGKMKEAGTAHWLSPNSGATNESEFSAFPGGYRYYGGSFDDVGRSGTWWSATEYDSYNAGCRYVLYNSAGVGRVPILKDYGYSVRCVRDN